jgi:poly-gamma-glutamate synthesis protein (capsule biosynthesis protein)
MLLVLAAAVAGTAVAAQAPPPLSPTDREITIPGTFTLVAVGDLIIRTPASQLADADVQAALRLVAEGDVAVGNMEGSLADYSSFEGPLSGFVGVPAVAADLGTMGFDMVNRANNHLFDSEAEGMFSTNRLLAEAGIVHAGSGQNLEEAAAPAFLETPRGRIALVGVHTPNGVASGRLAASSREGLLDGRPGLNILRYSERIVLEQEHVETLRRIRNELLETRDRYDNSLPGPSDAPSDEVDFFSSSSGREDPTYRAARAGEVPGTIDFELNSSDLARVLRSIHNAKQYADFVIAAIHSHQSQSVVERFHLSTQPPAFYVELAHQAIDAGADAWVGSGVHTLRGVEIYDGKPIFYGMSEFFRQMNWSLEEQIGTGVAASPVRAPGARSQSHESMLAVSRYVDGELVDVTIHPIELGYDGPNSRLGIPRVARGALGRDILERIRRLSAELGTNVEIEGEVGIIRVAGRSAADQG